MQFSSGTNKEAIIQRSTFLAFGDSQDHTVAFPLADMTASANRWVHNISLEIWRATGIWEIDDTNQTTLPSATTSLVNAQNDYSIPTTNFKLKRVEVLDKNGNWHTLSQKESREFPVALPEYQKNNGLPNEYRLIGNSLWLYPAPDNGISVTLASGLRIYFTRQFTSFNVPASYTTADITSPGFDEQFHDMIAIGIAMDWTMTNGPEERYKNLLTRYTSWTEKLYQHYAVKDGDKRTKVSPRREIYV